MLLSAVILLISYTHLTRCDPDILVPTNASQVIKDILQKYDRFIAPFDINGVPVKVYVNIEIRGLSSISAVSMDYVFSGYIREKWIDTRLSYHPDQVNQNQFIILDTATANRVWRPDLYVPNAKGSATNQFSYTRVYPNGTVHSSTSYTMPLTCIMDLHKFPMDNQTCPLEIESYAYSDDRLKFVWDPVNPIQVGKISTPDFYMTGYKTKTCQFRSITGQFSCLQLDIMLSRSIGFYLIQTIIPTVLIVIISWINFWISHKAVPARVSMAVTCVLTMVTQAASIRSGLPKVSYIKAIDVWMTSCLIFVFAALFEYAIVNVLARKETPHYYEVDQDDPKVKHDQDLIKGPGGKLFMVEYVAVHNSERKARSIESLARRLFPASFLLFNLVFWLAYKVW